MSRRVVDRFSGYAILCGSSQLGDIPHINTILIENAASVSPVETTYSCTPASPAILYPVRPGEWLHLLVQLDQSAHGFR